LEIILENILKIRTFCLQYPKLWDILFYVQSLGDNRSRKPRSCVPLMTEHYQKTQNGFFYALPGRIREQAIGKHQ
jgi:hypothetical protein